MSVLSPHHPSPDLPRELPAAAEVATDDLATLLFPAPVTERADRSARPQPLASPTALVAPTDDEVRSFFDAHGVPVIVAMNIAAFVTIATLAQLIARSWVFAPLLAVVVLMAMGAVLALVTGARRPRLTAAAHDARVQAYTPEVWPSVDVFLPTCGEPIDVLRNTYAHVARLEWPGEVLPVILDDADRPEVRDAALEFGFAYLVRPNRGHMKKAGNLAYAYGVTSADHIAIFDADFCPRPDFLVHLMPYMADPSVGIVQSPQVFDARADMNWLERGAGATQELFYRFIQPSRDAGEAAICVGTSALYKREALQANGGFADIDHSEDVYTGLELQRHGFAVRYVPVQVSKGLAPDTVAAFLNQQYRWGLGAMSLMRSRGFHRLPLTLTQRLAHWAGFLFYLTSALGVLVAEVPGILAILLFAATIEPRFYLGLLPALWVRVVLQPMVFRTSIRFDAQRVEMLYGFAHVFAVIDGMRGAAAAWVPTSATPRAGSATRGMPLARKVALTGVIVNALLLATLTAGLTAGVAEHGLAHLWMPLLLALLFAYIAVPVTRALLPVAFPGVRVGSSIGGRRSGRRGARLDKPMSWSEGAVLTAIIVGVGAAAALCA